MKGGASMLFAPESAIFPTLDHEIKGAYLLASNKTLNATSAAEAELAYSQTGSEGGLTFSVPAQLPKEQTLNYSKTSRPQATHLDSEMMFQTNQNAQSLDIIGFGS